MPGILQFAGNLGDSATSAENYALEQQTRNEISNSQIKQTNREALGEIAGLGIATGVKKLEQPKVNPTDAVKLNDEIAGAGPAGLGSGLNSYNTSDTPHMHAGNAHVWNAFLSNLMGSR